MVKEFFDRISKFFDKDIADEFRERISNPFFVALFFSWVAWNWELLFILFNFDSNYTLWAKIDCIKEYVNNDKCKWRLLWNPIIYALCAILLFSFLKQVSLLINLVIMNWVQPFIYKKVGSSDIVTKDRFNRVTKKVTRLREAYEKKVDEVNDMSEENQELRTAIDKAEEKADEYQNRYDDVQERYDKLIKNSLVGIFEGKWRNEHILPDGSMGDVPVEVKDGKQYFEKSRYVFDLDMIEVNKEASTLKFRKVGLGTDSRRVVNDLKIINDSEYRGIEENTTIITYTRTDNGSQILSFTPYYKKIKIIIGEKTNITFKFSNNLNKGLQILSYQFTSFHNRIKFATNEKHEDNYNVPGHSEKEFPFGEVDPLEYYFSNKREMGIFDSEITIEYRMDGSTDIHTLTRTARLIVTTGIIIRHARYGAKDKFADVTNKIREFVSQNKLEFEVNNHDLVGPRKEDDPYFGEVKTLEIYCVVDGKEKAIIVLEHNKVKIE